MMSLMSKLLSYLVQHVDRLSLIGLHFLNRGESRWKRRPDPHTVCLQSSVASIKTEKLDE